MAYQEPHLTHAASNGEKGPGKNGSSTEGLCLISVKSTPPSRISRETLLSHFPTSSSSSSAAAAVTTVTTTHAVGATQPPSTDTASPMTLTDENLTEHRHHSASLWENPNTTRQMQQDRSERTKAALQTLHIDLPEGLLNKVAVSFYGMTPMERLFAEQAWRQGREHSGEGHLLRLKPTNDAPYGASFASSGHAIDVECRSETKSPSSE